MMTLEQIKNKLSAYNLREVSRQTGVPYDTVYAISKGRNCHFEAGRKLAEFLGK